MSFTKEKLYRVGYSSSTTAAEFEIVHTQRMKPLAIHRGFRYRRYRTNKEDVVIWVCIREKSSKCHGRMKTKGNEVIQVTDHVCRMNEKSCTLLRKSKKRDRKIRSSTNDVQDQFVPTSVLMEHSLHAPADVNPYNDNQFSGTYQHSTLDPTALVEVSLSDNVMPQDSHCSFATADKGNMDILTSSRHSSDSCSDTVT